jgi:biopolymer transport protein ExbD
MHFRHGSRDEPEINLIPFIDVLLVVLIFLLLSTTYSTFTEMQLRLPVADVEAQRDYPKEVIVACPPTGAIRSTRMCCRTAVSKQSPRPGSGFNGARDSVVIISADANAAHQSVITVMEAAAERASSRSLSPQSAAQAGR